MIVAWLGVGIVLVCIGLGLIQGSQINQLHLTNLEMRETLERIKLAVQKLEQDASSRDSIKRRL